MTIQQILVLLLIKKYPDITGREIRAKIKEMDVRLTLAALDTRLRSFEDRGWITRKRKKMFTTQRMTTYGLEYMAPWAKVVEAAATIL